MVLLKRRATLQVEGAGHLGVVGGCTVNGFERLAFHESTQSLITRRKHQLFSFCRVHHHSIATFALLSRRQGLGQLHIYEGAEPCGRGNMRT